jgi:mono/diheme cytochrome c family protein
MKIRFWSILPVAMIILAAAFLSWRDIQKGSEIPEDVLTILSTHCYTCHTTGARSEDALKKVDFKKWDEYNDVKKIGILNDIKEVAEKGEMPPAKYLSRTPDKALSAEDRETLIEWTKKASAKLME